MHSTLNPLQEMKDMKRKVLARVLLFGFFSFLSVWSIAQNVSHSRLKVLTISEENEFKKLGSNPDLEVLTINCQESFRVLPDSIGKLKKLKELIIDGANGCSMNPPLPESIGDLQSLEKLVLFGAQDPRHGGSGEGQQPSKR